MTTAVRQIALCVSSCNKCVLITSQSATYVGVVKRPGRVDGLFEDLKVYDSFPASEPKS